MGQVLKSHMTAVRTKLSEELGHTTAADRKWVIDGSLDNLPVAST